MKENINFTSVEMGGETERKMRRKDKQIRDRDELIDILKNNSICRIALSEDNSPYIVPMNYGYRENRIFLHSAQAGKKIDILRKNNKICFEIDDSILIIPSDRACAFGTQYRSVIGFGEIFQLLEKEEKIEALKIIMQQHTNTRDWDFDSAGVEKIAVFEIRISSLTGKKSGL